MRNNCLAALAFLLLLTVSCQVAPSTTAMTELLQSNMGKKVRVVAAGASREHPYAGRITAVDKAAGILTVENDFRASKEKYYVRIDQIEAVEVEEEK